LPNGVFYNPTPAHLRLEDLPDTFLPLWSPELPMDLTVYVSEDSYFTNYKSQPVWNAENIAWGDYDDSREQQVEIPTTKVSNERATQRLRTVRCILNSSDLPCAWDE
jgi:hypothetical protein